MASDALNASSEKSGASWYVLTASFANVLPASDETA